MTETIEQEKAPADVAALTTMPKVDKLPVASGNELSAIVPRDVDEAWRLSMAFVRARMVPDSYEGANPEETAAKVMMGILKGMEVGLAPVSAISTIMIINKRPAIWGDGAVALVKRSGLLEYIKESIKGEPFTDEWTAICEVKRKGETEPKIHQFSWADAKRAGLINKGPWKQYPQRMLEVRPRAWCLRDTFADALNGLAIAEEVRDTGEEIPAITDTSSLD